MKKFIIIFTAVAISVIYIIRVFYINNNSYAPKIKKYNSSETVPIENDFFDSSNEKMNGYSVKLLNTELLTINEFESQYGSINNELQADYIYLVKVLFINDDNGYGKNAGIDLTQYILRETSYINFINREVYSMVNDFKSLSFSLRMNSEKEFIIPFGINCNHIDIDRIKNGSPELVISLYTNKKSVKLN